MKYLFILLLILSQNIYANDRFDKTVSVAVDAGLPHLIGFELSYIGIPYLELGISYGGMPVNNYINDSLDLSAVALDENFSILPSVSTDFSAPTFFLRYFPIGSGLYFQAAYSKWKISSSVSGSLMFQDNNTQSSLMSNAISGSVGVDLANISAMLGYQAMFSEGFFFSSAIGATVMLSPKASTKIGGEFSSVASVLDSSLSEAYSDTKAQIQEDIQSELDQLVDDYPVLPVVYFSFGKYF